LLRQTIGKEASYLVSMGNVPWIEGNSWGFVSLNIDKVFSYLHRDIRPEYIYIHQN
jgi:hypothetical protein